MYLIQSQSAKTVLLFEQLVQAQSKLHTTNDHTERQEWQREVSRLQEELRLEGM